MIDKQQHEEEMVNREQSMMNQTISNLNQDEVVIITTHNHPLYKVIDDNVLCEKAIQGQCLSLNNKSAHSKPMYFK